MKRFLLSLIIVWGAFVSRLAADEPAAALDRGNGDSRLREDLYRRFQQARRQGVADMWSPDAVYLNRITGEEVSGRDAIAKEFTAMFKDSPDIKMTAVTESVQFISPNVAEEHGNSTVTVPKEKPEELPYSAVYVKRDGKWLLDRVTDEAKQAKDSHYEQLKQLEWMVGHWVNKDENVDIETDCNWTKNRTFLTRSFTVSVEGEVDLSGMQIIGWDAAAKAIRSWTFDSDGGYAEANWTFKKVAGT